MRELPFEVVGATDVIQKHASLGAFCTCGEHMPDGRLDTPRWFAEHVAIMLWLDGYILVADR